MLDEDDEEIELLELDEELELLIEDEELELEELLDEDEEILLDELDDESTLLVVPWLVGEVWQAVIMKTRAAKRTNNLVFICYSLIYYHVF